MGLPRTGDAQMQIEWNTVLTAAQIEEYLTTMAKLDPAFAANSRKFWETRTPDQLRVIRVQAWDYNGRENYVLANSYLALAA
jgi:hypothetical protein